MTAMWDRDAELQAPDEFDPFHPMNLAQSERVSTDDYFRPDSLADGQRT